MRLCRLGFAAISLVASCWAADQDVLTILEQQSDISTFVGLLQQFPDLVDILNGGTFSGMATFHSLGFQTRLTLILVLVPNDEAMALFENANQDLNGDTDAIRALLEYHIANGTHPSATFGLQPLFVPTLLSNPNYTNVTGGQVVELVSADNQSAIVSGVKAISRIVQPVGFQDRICHSQS